MGSPKRKTTSNMFGTASYSYDVLDNITRATVGTSPTLAARDWYYCYTGNRLSNVKTGSCAGATVIGLEYDVQGNVVNRSGQVYSFDYGNRLRSATGEAYRYDGYGRRVLSNASAGNIVSMYGQSGQLLYTSNNRTAKRTEYIYLGGSLVAQRERPTSSETATVKYQHTDALGSPIAITDANKAFIDKTEYEPYGRQSNRPVVDGPGYTGHVQDAATGLTYMQERYYDPQLGVFDSVDPVTAYQKPVTNFCRYCYARNNPYKFTDPDGRDVEVALRAYLIGHAPIQGDYGHQYVYLRDTDTGEEMISRAGPSAKYPGGVSDVVSRSPVQDPGGKGNVTLVTELGPASQSADANPNTGQPLGSTVDGSQVTIPGSIGQAAATLQNFNNKVDAANIDYKPLSTNSNAYAGTAYAELTGKPAPSSSTLPGSDVNLKKQLEPDP